MAMVQHYPAVNRTPVPVCSVCIANYNGAGLLEGCLNSILAQAGGIAIEIIVHDDASTDDSVAFLRHRYPQVELLVSTQNVGFCVGNNRMVAHARGEFVLLLNNDAALDKDALQTFLDAARKQERPAILTLPQYDWESGALVDRGCLLDPFYNPVPNLDTARSEVAYVIGACLWIPRVLWNELGGFPEWMESIGEDLYLGCVARLHGCAVMALPASGYRHRQGATFGGNRADAKGLLTTFRRRYLSERNKTTVMVICTPTALVWPLLAVHVCLLCIEGILLASIRRDSRIWREIYQPALGYVFRELPALRRRRFEVQRKRSISLRGWRATFTLIPRKIALLWRHGLPTVR